MLVRTGRTTDDNAGEGLVRAAREGDPKSFAHLIELHYAGMLAAACRLLGPGPDAEDACQDAAITAFGRLSDLRDPAAVRPWLHAIVRNNCLGLLRTRRPVPVGVAGTDRSAPDDDDPAALVERHAQRDWIRHGLAELTPAAQTVAILRYFTEHNSYEHIAALCGIPVGTVRSRLSEARRQLAVVLPRVRDQSHAATAARHAERHEEAAALLTAMAGNVSFSRVTGRWARDLTFHWPGGRQTSGLEPMFGAFRSDYDAGVRHELTGVVAGVDITVWEHTFVNPAVNPFHCPPGGTWLLRERDGLISEVRLLHTPRPSPPARVRARGQG